MGLTQIAQSGRREREMLTRTGEGQLGSEALDRAREPTGGLRSHTRWAVVALLLVALPLVVAGCRFSSHDADLSSYDEVEQGNGTFQISAANDTAFPAYNGAGKGKAH